MKQHGPRNQKMKLWLLTTEYPPQSGGGISTYCWHTARMFAEKSHEVTVFVPAHQSIARKIVQQQDGIRIVYIRADSNEQNSFLGWEAALSYEFSKALKEFQDEEGEPDFIEAQEYNGIAYFALQRRLLEPGYLPQSTFYITAHAPGFLYLDVNQAPVYQFPYYWTGEMERSALRSADFVLSPSQFLLQALTPYVKLDDVTCEVLRNPFKPYAEYLSYTPRDIVFFGKLTLQKGALEMLEYCRELWEGGENIILNIIGGEHFFYPKGMEMGEYVRKRFSKYVENKLLVFEGHIPPEQLEERLSKAHVVIVPSVIDNLPYTVLEAMSMGKIVLASRQGGHAELIDHGLNGFTFTHDSPESFGKALRQILTLDEQKTKSIGARARQTIIDKCGYEIIYAKKMALLRGLNRKRPANQFPYNRPRPRTLQPLRKQLTSGLLSVVIPYYNLPEYIMECVDSVFNGLLKNFEILIVDDGSTDPDSPQALEAVTAKYPSVRIIRKSNQGLAAARNTGAQHATGEFVAFLDADDLIDPAYYTRAVEVLQKFENVSFVGSWLKYFGENDAVWPAFTPEPPYHLVHNMAHCALICRTDHFLTSGMNDPQMIYGMEDYESSINMVKHGFQGVMLPAVLFHYRVRKGSMANSFTRYSRSYLYRLISRKHADFYAEYAAEIVNILNANGPGLNYDNPTFPTVLHSQVTSATGTIRYTWRMRFVDWLKRYPWLYHFGRKLYFKFFVR